MMALMLGATWFLLSILEKPIRLRLEEEINQRLQATVSFDDISLSLWSDFPNPTAKLSNLIIAGHGPFEGDTLLVAPEFSVEVSVWGLLKGDTELKSVKLNAPHVRLITTRDGISNYSIIKPDTLAPTQADSEGLEVNLDAITIRDGVISFEDRSTRTALLLTGVDHAGTGAFAHDVFDYQTITRLGEVTIDYDGIRYFDKRNVDVEMGLEVDTRSSTFRILHNAVRINHFKFRLEGGLTMLKEGFSVDMKFSSPETNLRNILSLLPGVYMDDASHFRTTGAALFEGFVIGSYTGIDKRIPAFHVDLQVKDGTFQLDTLPAPLKNIQFELVLDNSTGVADSTVIDLRRFHFDLNDQPFRGRFRVQGAGEYQVDADIKSNVNLHELETIFPISGYQVKGRMNFELVARGKYFPPPAGKSWMEAPEVPNFSFNAELTEGGLHYDSMSATVEDVHMHIAASNTTGLIKDTQISLNKVHMRLDDNQLTGFAHVRGLDEMKVDADLHLSLDLADLERLFPADSIQVAGNLNIDIRSKGILQKSAGKFPATEANLTLKNGYLLSLAYPEAIEQMFLTARLVNRQGTIKDTELNISRCTYQFEEEPFEVSGRVSDFEVWNYDLKVHGLLDLAKFTKIVPVKGLFMQGLVDVNVETTGRVSDLEAGQYGATTTTGTVEVTNLLLTGYAIPRPIQIVDAHFNLTPKVITMDRMLGRFGKSRFTMTGDLTNYLSFVTSNRDLIKGDLKLTCDTLYVSELVPVTDSTAIAAKGGYQIIPVPGNIDFTFDSDIRNVIYEDIHISKLDGEVRIHDQVLSMHEAGFNSLGAAFNLRGDYDTRDLKHPKFDFHVDVQDLDIQKAWHGIRLMRTLAPAAEHSEGQFSMKYDIRGELDEAVMPRTETLTGGGRVRIANARINGMRIFEELSKAAKKNELNDPHLRDFTIDTEIRNSKIFVKPFSIKVSGFNADVEGVNEISGAIQYLVRVELLPIEGIRIPFHVTGTYDNPKVVLGKGHKLPE